MIRSKRCPIGWRALASVMMFCLGMACIGCGPAEKTPNKAEQAMISGTVTLDGSKPAKQDTGVEFYCTEKSVTALGKVDSLGKFSLKATDKTVGIPAGRYQVMIRPPVPAATAPQVNSTDYKSMMMQGGGAAAPPSTESEIPLKLHSQNTSQVYLEVKAGANTFDLDVSKL